MQRKLQLLNSLSQKLEYFEPCEGRALEWYVCGPTVYDVSHLGHARNYVATDAMRRILEDYFGYRVKQCMNITDVDDKILRRSEELGVEFEQLARFYEAEFFADLRGLNCRLPSVVTRVTEHLPQIVAYVEQIIANGFAYEAQGSVYFDVEAFRSHAEHRYPKLEPSNMSDAAVRDEQVLIAARAQGKRSFRDFALWKRVGAEEVGWSSPWGRGRPGWHIECSAMASYALQPVIDLHSGGVDLRFPHHDNEIAQCEAYFQSDDWVRYFLHVGHLNINGCKMSKSLKNFVSIREMLKRHTFQEIRILFLLHQWAQPMNFTLEASAMREASEYHRVFQTFFATLKPLMAETGECATFADVAAVDLKALRGLSRPQKVTAAVGAFWSQLERCADALNQAYCKNFDTPSALLHLKEFCLEVLRYVRETRAEELNSFFLLEAARLVRRHCGILGLCAGAGLTAYNSEVAEADLKRFGDVVTVLCEFRRDLREGLRGLIKKCGPETKSLCAQLLKRCDALRDVDLPRLSVALEDDPVKGFVWRDLQ